MHQQAKIAGIVLLIVTISLVACHKGDETAALSVLFTQKVGNSTFVKDSLQYSNAAGNHYEVNDLQYFISDVTLHKLDGEDVILTFDNGIHYVDIDIPATQTWKVDMEIPKGDYGSVSFTFGINEAKNKTGLFVNPPERDMFWPDAMGGGYHYMKMNGQWLDTLNQLTPFNFHIGIGMMDKGMGDMGFVQNYFTINVPNSGVSLADNEYRLTLIMDIASWFETPHIWDWDSIGGQIMQKQWAMKLACENGSDAFGCSWSLK